MSSIAGVLTRLTPGVTVRGPLLPEPIRIIAVVPMGGSVQIIGQGLVTNQVHQPILSAEQLALLTVSPEREPFDGDARRFRLGIEALRLGLAYEYDPLFSLSIARVDPLPHQLEAVYDYFLKLPRIRFLLADDPGAGKTIMAGLLIKELKARGLARRILIVTPANLSFQWQRELKDKFREQFEVIRGDVLRANYGSNPWQERHQVITSVSWVSVIEDARESLLRSQWDLIVVDEAHKMAAYAEERKTLAYQLGEALSERTDHYLLMTATPHKGDKANFRLFLALLDRDVYADMTSLEAALAVHEAPFYLRRVKEALVKFPDPETGTVEALFTKRLVYTTGFQIDAEEYDFYLALTRYVEDQSIKAAADHNASRGRAVGFTMAMLQRRFASSVYAVRRSLERMRDKRQRILDDPEGYRQQQIERRIPDDFDELPDDEQQDILAQLEEVVASVNPLALKREIGELDALIAQARTLEAREVESKLVRLRALLDEQGVFGDPKMKLLIFTEHKDTLDYLVGKLSAWGLSVCQIHGGMKIGDRDMPGTRIYAERAFRESAQVMVATEAAGEGINLQFCWLMLNYDIPWNPVRLEQRMGRIHRYGQERDCLVFNFVATNTREGSVLQKLLQRLHEIENELDPKRTGKIFNVLGDVFPANEIDRMLRDMYAHNLTDEVIKNRIVALSDPERFRHITSSALEGLAKRELNLSAIVGRSAEAKERRLVPEVVEDFFVEAAPLAGLEPRPFARNPHVYRLGKVPRTLWPIGEAQEPRFGRLGHEYQTIAFDKSLLTDDPTLDWVTPGHPLFEALREHTHTLTETDLQRGAVFYDINHAQPVRLDVFTAAIRDGLGHVLHRRLFVVQTAMDGTLSIRQPTLFAELQPAPAGTPLPGDENLPSRTEVQQAIYDQALVPLLGEVSAERLHELDAIRRHMELSLNAIIDRANLHYADLFAQKEAGSRESGLDGRLKQAEDRLAELNARLEQRQRDLDQERHCTVDDLRHMGRAWVLPHPDRESPAVAPMVRDDEIEQIAVEAVKAYEQARGWQVETVETENRGFDLISRRPSSDDPAGPPVEVRFIEVKGRAGEDIVPLTPHEHKTAERLGADYWLYVVFNCGTPQPQVYPIRDPIRLDWQSVIKIEHFFLSPDQVLRTEGEYE